MRLPHALALVAATLLAPAALPQDALPPPVMGQIVWPGHDLSVGEVRVYSDAALKTPVDAFGTGGQEGKFVLIIDPGEYYLMAVVDGNRNKALDAGDGLGFYGVSDYGAEGQGPKPLKVTGTTIVADVLIPIVAVLEPDDEGKLRPQAIENAGAVDAAPTGIPAAISGAISAADGVTQPLVVMLMDSGNRLVADIARASADRPAFELEAPAGTYHLIAMADVSGDSKIGAGDRFGSVDLPDWGTPPESLPVIALQDGEELTEIDLPLTGHVGDDLLTSPPGGQGAFKLDPALIAPVIAGRVAYPAAGLKPVQVRISVEPMGKPVAGAECEPGPGTFIASVEPGAYYLTAIVDESGDGSFGPGDTIGVYGLTDLASGTAPKAVNVESGSLVTDVEITIVMRINPEGRPEPLPATTEE